jgi:cytochrome P450
MVRTVREHLDRWERLTNGETVDASREFMGLTLRIVGRTLFSTDIDDSDGHIGAAITTLQRFLNDRETAVVKVPLSIPTPANRKARAALEVLDGMVFEIIDRRRTSGSTGDDLLGMLLDARDERTHDGMSDQQLRDEVMTLVLAGHETTASAMAWTMMLLSQSPIVERHAAEEVRTVLGGRAPTFEDLPRLRYVSMVVQESLRLYPPAWAIERVALADDEIGGFTIPAGGLVVISAYTMHRHPLYWEDPEGFDPERFAPERAEHRPRGAYIPFGAGPRICIGNQFALMEAQLVLAMILQRYRLDLVPGHPIVPEPLITLRPRDGMPMRIYRRS